MARSSELPPCAVEGCDRVAGLPGSARGWCGLCGEPIDPDATWPDPAMASVDHIVPVSRGGKHERANVQAAHLGCNVHKGAAMAEVA